MAKARKKANEEKEAHLDQPAETSTAVAPREPDVFDEQIACQAEQVHRDAEHRAATAHIANPSSVRRPHHGFANAVSHRRNNLPSTLGIKAGDMQVQLIDKGNNMAGIGIRVVFPEDRKPTEEEKAIIRHHVKGEGDERTGFNYNGSLGMWHKDIARPGEGPSDIPASRAVAIRLDAESRVEKLAEALRQHSADPVGFAESVRQRREEAANAERIPD